MGLEKKTIEELASAGILNQIDAQSYDFDESAEDVAKKRGQIVVFPNEDQLQIDIDSEEQYEMFQRRFQAFGIGSGISDDRGYIMDEKPSKSGLPSRHITITCPGRKFTEGERIAYQAALGSDPVREFLNAMRLYHGNEKPSRLFQNPKP